MVGLRRSFWPMMAGCGRSNTSPEGLTNYLANPSNETPCNETSCVMAPSAPPRDWTDIRWPEVSAADATQWIVVLPLAATEQHGPHLPLGTDVMIGEAYLARVRELLPVKIPATFLPLQPVGISTEHIDYPGTQTLSTEAALRTWMALGESVARAGIRKFVMVTSHGGNSAAMTLVAQDLRARHGMLAVTTGWSRFGAPEGVFAAEELRHGIHGGAVETSIMLARYREHVRTEAIADFRSNAIAIESEFRWLSTQRPAPFAWQAQDLHPSGAVGDARQATAEKGEKLLDHGARAFCELLADVDNFDVKRLGGRPDTPSK
jgi:creatinine amidohydrolase